MSPFLSPYQLHTGHHQSEKVRGQMGTQSYLPTDCFEYLCVLVTTVEMMMDRGRPVVEQQDYD